MFPENLVITQIISAGSALCGVLITGVVSIANQHYNKKNKEHEIKQQLIFKVIEEELKERKSLIKPLLQFIDSYNLPTDHDFFDEEGQSLERSIIKSYPEIKRQISNFMLNYSVFMSDDIRDAVWSLSSSINKLQSLDAKFFDNSKSTNENNDLTYMNCGSEPFEIWTELLKLRTLLLKEIRIRNML